MAWTDPLLEHLAAAEALGYRPGGSPASEPTALAALALLAQGRAADAEPKLRWLAERQAADGSVGITATEAAPGWPTPLAVLAWARGTRDGASADRSLTKGEDSATSLSRLPQRPRWSRHIHRATDWLLRTEGKQVPPSGEGHDTTLIGWPWVDGTHSWVEPTALAILALKATGRGGHPRTREAVRLLLDRLLPDGGCNCGNTVVFGQTLVPQVQPTGLALLALAGEHDPSCRIERSIEYLWRALDEHTTPASLAYGLLGLAAHGRECCMSEEWLAAAAAVALKRQSALEMALLLLGAAGPSSLLVQPRANLRK